jgi:branched-subunit amino acid aminotransferase/4-amino-4-deoxychorismate lyase
LPSITRLEVFEMANQAGYSTATEQVKPEDLDGLEIWSLSSFTGIRPVVDWVNLAGSVGPQRHLESFQRRLKMMASEL